ncbi:hypothetical protein Naga_102277g1 [Nannochloropsis gaditana]|uniref:Roadblock/LAMTOR2 domain-containing protein n=1 Tax=Nannochloropsis gaditana TaxID=72520 RepID=W7SZW8_9STRA|nr:hypothetical protein Naga_102277g1 [Nannochloropsis gaditana]
MIRALTLHEILTGRLGDSVRAALVYNHEGALLGAAAVPPAPPSPEENPTPPTGMPSRSTVLQAQATAAITSHIWDTYGGVGSLVSEPVAGGRWEGGRERRRALETMILEMEGARLVVAPAGPQYLVCLVGSEKAEVGMLMAKAQALGAYLRDGFGQLQAAG